MLKGRYNFIFILSFLLFFSAIIYPKPSATQGRNFIVGFMQNEIHRTDLQTTFYLSIFISASQSDTVYIKIQNRPQEAYHLIANQVREIKIPLECEITTLGVSKNKLITVRSKTPINIWTYSSKNQSSDSYVAIPVGMWGNEYRVISMGNDMYNGRKRLIDDGCIDSLGNITNSTKYREQLTPRSSEFLVMSAFDNTIVEYFPTNDTKNGILKGQKESVILDAGDCLLVQGAEGNVGTNDLTGTLIRSNNPIGVISGHTRTSVRQGLDNPYDTKDHLADMLPPIKAWGKHFISIPFINGQNVSADNYRNLCESGDLIKILAAESNTTINYAIQRTDTTLENKTVVIKNAGDYLEIEINSPTIWTSDKPVLISQLMMHKGFEDETFNYDPTIVVLTPIEQYVSETSFSTPSNSNVMKQYVAHCFILITDSAGIYDLYHNGVRLSADNTEVWCKQIGNSKYYWIMKVLTNGQHTIVNSKGDFSGIIYGHGQRDSYSMTLGGRFSDPFSVDSIPPLVEIDSTCGVIKIKVTDIKKNDPNATGIDWGTAKNLVNYSISGLNISDTATSIEFIATPIDTTKDGSFDIEFIDKDYNFVRKYFRYTGFNVERPAEHNFGMLKWVEQTEATLFLKSNSNDAIRLLGIEQSTDTRLNARVQYNLPKTFYKNDQIEVKLTFTPDVTLAHLNTKIGLIFDCYRIDIPITGKISAPGLLADDLDFGKVRLYDKKTLTGKIHNAGNIDLTINNVSRDVEETTLEWNFNKSFPYNLAIDDSINYSVIFTPTEERNYVVNSIVKNDDHLECDFYVKGIGARPKIENVKVDWGRKRIGTKNDTSIYITNTGNFNDTINYKSNIYISHNSDLSIDSTKKISNLMINERDSILMNYCFIPTNTTPLENTFELVSKWSHHEPITATFIGQGTIPELNTYNYDFGDVSIFSNILHNHNCVYSFGNETLTIDSIVLIGGDTNSFIIDYSKLYNLYVEPNEYFEIPVTFSPTSKGLHKIFLEITSDANPNYLRSKDTIEIYGNCITENTDLVVDLQLPIIRSCVTEELLLNIENIGEANIIIDSILLIGEPNVFISSFKNTIQDMLPIELISKEKISFPINVYIEKDKAGTLNIEIFYNNESKIIISETIKPIASTIQSTIASTVIIPKETMLPGDTLYLIFQSDILEKSENNFEYKIKLYTNKEQLYCLKENCLIEINTNGKEHYYPVPIKQYLDRIEFSLPTDFFEINATTIFQFELPFYVLLAEDKKINIDYELISERCYYPTATNFHINISPICADTLRILTFDAFSYIDINQNPTTDKIELTLNLLDDDIITIVVYDLLGNEIYNMPNKNYEKGKYNIKIDMMATDYLPLQTNNAVFFVQTKSKTINTTLKVILQK